MKIGPQGCLDAQPGRVAEMKNGDRVLVERAWSKDLAEYERILSGGQGGEVHPHPGVPPVDLLLEIYKLRVHVAWLQDLVSVEINPTTDHCWLKAEKLRKAREAAQKPQLKEGQEAWAKVKLLRRQPGNEDAWLVGRRDGRVYDDEVASVHQDDIKVDDE